MNIKKVLTVVISFLIITILVARTSAQETAQPTSPEKEKVQQKITTPPLELSEEEKKEPPLKTAPPAVKPAIKPPATKEPIKAEAKVERRPPLEEVEFAPTPVKTKSRIELILDASGSMNGIMGPTTKIEILKSVVKEVIAQPLPEGAEREVGLRVYGDQKPSSENDCKDTQLLIPIGPINKKEFREKINDLTAQGVTPIGYSLEQALEDFNVSTDVDNIIILVTDGADSCNANVCQIAEKLHTNPKRIIIHVVGFDLDQKSAEALECVAKNSDGQFIMARSESELRSALDQVLMANIPYNLRVKIMSGATPLPSSLKVYKSGTDRLIREDKTSGIKFYQLPPGTYDIEVVYTDSKETPQPSKVVRKVEVQATSKAEQIVQFDLGMLTLSAFDQDGNPTEATYEITKKEDPKVRISVKTKPVPFTTWLTEGTYNVKVDAVTKEGLEHSAVAEGLIVDKSEAAVHEFHFKVGTVKLVGKDSKGKDVALTYRVTPAGNKEKTILEGSTEEIKTLSLPPGKYDIYATLAVKGLKDLPHVKLESIEVTGGETIEEVAELPTALLTLSGKDSEGKIAETLFTIKRSGSDEKPVEFMFTKEPITLVLAPTNYDIKAVLQETDITPPPSLSWDSVGLVADQDLKKEAVFKFGALKLFGRNTKGVPVQTGFYIYRVGEDEPVASFVGVLEWVQTKLIEGFYDIKAVDLSARHDPKPSLWFHNIHITAEAPSVWEAIFTHGILKMICRGPNDVILQCDYRVFAYGMDSPLFKGTTEERWRDFEIPPGSYYIEAGYHDAEDEVLLKKWVTISIEPNEMLEQVIRF